MAGSGSAGIVPAASTPGSSRPRNRWYRCAMSLILLAALGLTAGPAAAQQVALPADQDPAVWAPVLAQTGLTLDDDTADIRLLDRPWRLEVTRTDGRRRVLEVDEPTTDAARADLLFLALSMRQPALSPTWGDVPPAPAQPEDEVELAAPSAKPVTVEPPRPPSPSAPEAPPVDPTAPTAPTAVAFLPPEPVQPPQPPTAVLIQPAVTEPAPPTPTTGPPVYATLGAGLLADPDLSTALHLRGGLSLDPAPWARLSLLALGTTRREHAPGRTLSEVGVGLSLAHHRGPWSIELGTDLRSRTFRQDGSLIQRGVVPLGQLTVGWTLPRTTTALTLSAARDLRGVAFFEGEQAIGALSPWSAQAAVVLTVPLTVPPRRAQKADQPDQAATPWP